MGKISREDFCNEIEHMYGCTTAFVYDEPNNRNMFGEGEVDNRTMTDFEESDCIYEMSLYENKEVFEVMNNNFTDKKAFENARIFMCNKGELKIFMLAY